MFTGIVEELGQIETITESSISIRCSKVLEDVKLGDSIAVNGTCLTVTTFNNSMFSADISSQTKNSTKLNNLAKNDLVNLERAMLANSRFGGHIVTGHVDCTGIINKIAKQGEFYDLRIKLPSNENSQYIVKKGSITIDGISLTIGDITNSEIIFAIIPHTFENTNMKSFKIGDNVNIEFDILAKYVEKNLSLKDNGSNITNDFLTENGFL